jgi:hypothetical protein
MIKLIKTPITGFVIAGVVAVMPTLIIAELASQPSSSPSVALGPKEEGWQSGSAQFRNVQSDFSGPATRPSRPGGFGAGGFGGGGGGPGGGPFGGEGRNRLGLGRASQEEMQSAIDFFKENSPHRMEYFYSFPEGSAARRMATIKLAEAYRPILNFKDSQPELYGLLVKQVKLRDEAFELAKEGKDAELRDKAAEIVPIALKARTKRLDLLQQELDEQKAKLSDDKANQDATAEREVSSIKDDEEWWARPRGQAGAGTRGTTMLNLDTAADPLADMAPIVTQSSGGRS